MYHDIDDEMIDKQIERATKFLQEKYPNLKEQQEKIARLTDEANEKIVEAQKLADEYGIPFAPHMFYGTYVPTQIVDLHQEVQSTLEEEFGEELEDIQEVFYSVFDCDILDSNYELGEGWWQPSRLC